MHVAIARASRHLEIYRRRGLRGGGGSRSIVAKKHSCSDHSTAYQDIAAIDHRKYSFDYRPGLLVRIEARPARRLLTETESLTRSRQYGTE
jgi:hypothetical protein